MYETSETYYSRLAALVGNDRVSVREKYLALRDLFYRVADVGIAEAPIHVAGLFAKIDYIVRKNEVGAVEACAIHDTRHSLNDFGKMNDSQLAANWLYDVKATAMLVGLVFGEATVPAALAGILPPRFREHVWTKTNERVVRAIVEEWDDEFIYVVEEQNNTVMKVCYSRANRYMYRVEDFDWDYIVTLLKKGTALNLVRVRMTDGICYPELIIYEPDYLINVTTIATCFETYAESADVNLINKLAPQTNNRFQHLGNLSGQFLDDTVHGRKVSFEEAWEKFLKVNSLGLITCPDLKTAQSYADFCMEARQQQANINKLIGEDLHHLPRIGDYHREDIILEPTFFSEVLGIQGRMDFLWETREEDPSRRRTIIIEQKSGKGEFAFNGRGQNSQEGTQPAPDAKEPHLVQLNLYRALFYYEFGKKEGTMEYPMLLYSKYANGLVTLGPNLPKLLLRSVKLRNELAHREIQYSEEGLGQLATLRAEDFRQKRVSDKFWTTWVKPKIDAVLDPIHNATELERAYVFRFLRFVEKEQLLAKIGNRMKESSGFASVWQDSLEDKKAAGNIYDDLTLMDFGHRDNDTEVVSVRLRFHEVQSADTSNFRRGDIVILYPYKVGEVPDACRQMVVRASIVDITAEWIELRLRNAQTDSRVFGGEGLLWAVEHDMFESSTSSLYSGLHSFLRCSKERRDLVLCQRLPRVDDSLVAKGEYGAFDELVTKAKQARELFLVIGPPGTGKTSYGLLYQLKEELMEEGSNVLLLSYTNRAVDEFCSKLVEDGIDFIRVGSELTCDPAYHPYLLINKVKGCRSGGEMVRMIRSARVVCGTTSGLNANQNIFALKHFSLAIIDESSQILEPHLVGLLSAKDSEGREAIDKFVLIGDHKQLPAVVQQSPEESKVTEEILHAINLTDCRLSLFERLLKQFKTVDGYDSRFVYMLTKQGRMHRDIALFPNVEFYGGKLDVVPLPHQLRDCQPVLSQGSLVELLTSQRFIFLPSRQPEFTTSLKTNIIEAQMIAEIVHEIYRLTQGDGSSQGGSSQGGSSQGGFSQGGFSREKTVGVIVPYRNQISTVRNAIDKYGVAELHDITIDTVERYQGSQRDYIIYGFTVQQPYQLDFLTNNVFEEDGMTIDRKLNVALTRARLCMVMIGNPALLKLNGVFAKLMENKKG